MTRSTIVLAALILMSTYVFCQDTDAQQGGLGPLEPTLAPFEVAEGGPIEGLQDPSLDPAANMGSEGPSTRRARTFGSVFYKSYYPRPYYYSSWGPRYYSYYRPYYGHRYYW